MTELQKVRVIDVPARREGAWIQKITAKRVDAVKLKAELAAMLQRGEVAEAFNWTEEGGVITVYVERVREPRTRLPWYVAAVAGGMGAVVGVGTMLYHSRWVWLALLSMAALVWLVCKTLAGHSAGCPGLHCSGCQG